MSDDGQDVYVLAARLQWPLLRQLGKLQGKLLVKSLLAAAAWPGKVTLRVEALRMVRPAGTRDRPSSLRSRAEQVVSHRREQLPGPFQRA